MRRASLALTVISLACATRPELRAARNAEAACQSAPATQKAALCASASDAYAALGDAGYPKTEDLAAIACQYGDCSSYARLQYGNNAGELGVSDILVCKYDQACKERLLEAWFVIVLEKQDEAIRIGNSVPSDKRLQALWFGRYMPSWKIFLEEQSPDELQFSDFQKWRVLRQAACGRLPEYLDTFREHAKALSSAHNDTDFYQQKYPLRCEVPSRGPVPLEQWVLEQRGYEMCSRDQCDELAFYEATGLDPRQKRFAADLGRFINGRAAIREAEARKYAEEAAAALKVRRAAAWAEFERKASTCISSRFSEIDGVISRLRDMTPSYEMKQRLDSQPQRLFSWSSETLVIDNELRERELYIRDGSRKMPLGWRPPGGGFFVEVDIPEHVAYFFVVHEARWRAEAKLDCMKTAGYREPQ